MEKSRWIRGIFRRQSELGVVMSVKEYENEGGVKDGT